MDPNESTNTEPQNGTPAEPAPGTEPAKDSSKPSAANPEPKAEPAAKDTDAPSAEELAAFRKWQESQKSEIEKQTAAYQKSEKARIEAETKISDYEAKFAALKNGVSADSVDDVVALAKLKTDKNTSLEQAIESVLEKYPQFRGKGITTGVHTSNSSDKMSGVEAAFYAKNPDLKA